MYIKSDACVMFKKKKFSEILSRHFVRQAIFHKSPDLTVEVLFIWNTIMANTETDRCI